jgi:hypothetical protein
MEELEGHLESAARATPFSQYNNDLTPAEAHAIRAHFSRIREAMYAHLRHLNIPFETRRASLRWIIESTLTHLQVVVDDLGPKSLKAYGEVDESAKRALALVQQDMSRLLEQAQALVRRRS